MNIGNIISGFLYIIKDMFNMNGITGTGPSVKYDGAQMWRAEIPSADDVEKAKHAIENEDLMIWRVAADSIDFMVPEKDRRKIRRMLRSNGWEPTVVIKDVQKLVEESAVRLIPWDEKYLRFGHRLDFKNFPQIDVIEEFFTYLQNNYPNLVNITTIGASSNSKPIKVIKISNRNPNNVRVVITGGQHAREWIGITSALYIANELITKFNQQPQYVKTIDWYIVPLTNPDGYQYSISTDRMWRKNRRSVGSCTGVDLNRNYPCVGKYFNVPGVTTFDECEPDYGGTSPLSELETQAINDLIKSMEPKIPKAYVDFHSYGQLILHPWAAMTEESVHHELLTYGGAVIISGLLKSMGAKVPRAYVDFHNYGQLILYPWAGDAKRSDRQKYLHSTGQDMKWAINRTTGLQYKVGSPPMLLYKASGSSLDYFHSVGVTLSYAIESRDTGDHGFLVPPSQIISAGQEMFAAMKALARMLSF